MGCSSDMCSCSWQLLLMLLALWAQAKQLRGAGLVGQLMVGLRCMHAWRCCCCEAETETDRSDRQVN